MVLAQVLYLLIDRNLPGREYSLWIQNRKRQREGNRASIELNDNECKKLHRRNESD